MRVAKTRTAERAMVAMRFGSPTRAIPDEPRTRLATKFATRAPTRSTTTATMTLGMKPMMLASTPCTWLKPSAQTARHQAGDEARDEPADGQDEQRAHQLGDKGGEVAQRVGKCVETGVAGV